jgi:hypothetical protein
MCKRGSTSERKVENDRPESFSQGFSFAVAFVGGDKKQAENGIECCQEPGK